MATYQVPGDWLRDYEALDPGRRARVDAHAARLVLAGWREDTARRRGMQVVATEDRRRGRHPDEDGYYVAGD